MWYIQRSVLSTKLDVSPSSKNTFSVLKAFYLEMCKNINFKVWIFKTYMLMSRFYHAEKQWKNMIQFCPSLFGNVLFQSVYSSEYSWNYVLEMEDIATIRKFHQLYLLFLHMWKTSVRKTESKISKSPIR